jgi:hypothetical protein
MSNFSLIYLRVYGICEFLFWMYVKIFVISSRNCHWERLIEPVTQSIKKDVNLLDPKADSHYFHM